MDRYEDESRPVSPAALELLPCGDARKLRHELGWPLHEVAETRGAPKLPHPAQADESSPIRGRQPERLRELNKQIDVLGPAVALGRRTATKELEPPCVHAMRDVAACAVPNHLVDEAFRTVEPLPLELRGEMPPDAALRGCYLVQHGLFTSR